MTDDCSRLPMKCGRRQEFRKRFFPPRFLRWRTVRIAVRYAPMTAVAGDLYDFPPAPPNCLAVFVADVMGHGVPAALVASMLKVAASRTCGHDHEPAMVIAGLNAILCAEAHQQYATAVYLYLDPVSGAGRYSAAAHPPPLLWRRGKQSLEVLGETGLLLGVRPKEAYVENEFSFEVGDRLLVYTDGLLEAENAAGESFGDAALVHLHQGKARIRSRAIRRSSAEGSARVVERWDAGAAGR